ncbi:MAG: carbohydrate ABC transporter permease, partial [Oscillospiraceae bacterium]
MENGKNMLSLVFKVLLLTGLAFVILFPFIVKISSAFMSIEDTYDNTVGFIPKNPTLDNITYIIKNTPFIKATLMTALLSLVVAVLSTVSATFVGYGLAKYRFKGNGLVMGCVLFTLLVPSATVMIPMYTRFRYFDIFGIIEMIKGSPGNLTDTFWPMIFLSITCLGFRGGLYVMIMRQIFRSIPHELAEAAAVDGVGAFRTFIQIMVPLAKPMMTVVFLFSFSWQWTDTFYSSTLFSNIKLLPNVVALVQGMNTTGIGSGTYTVS